MSFDFWPNGIERRFAFRIALRNLSGVQPVGSERLSAAMEPGRIFLREAIPSPLGPRPPVTPCNSETLGTPAMRFDWPRDNLACRCKTLRKAVSG
jgi:hypothetical protein